MEQLYAVILAAGEGKRMKSKHSKVLQEVSGIPMLRYVCDAARNAGVTDIISVVGHKGKDVENYLEDYLGDMAVCVWQEKQLGTGHAVMQAEGLLADKEGTVIILCGDTPAITDTTLSELIKTHTDAGNAATILTAEPEDPFGYGRVIRDEAGTIKGIVEQKDASAAELECREINSGVYCFDIRKLITSLGKINNNNSQGEYYLTDTIGVLIGENEKVGSCICEDVTETMGVNDRVQLAAAEKIIKDRINTEHMREGVTIIDPENTYISPHVSIGRDTVIYPGCIIGEAVVIGEDCVIGPNTRIESSTIGDETTVKYSVILDSIVNNGSSIGPFAYLRPGSRIGRKVKIGDFVEVKNSTIGDKSSVSHLTYVGDADVGRNVNLGCGVVFVNYDGHKKFRTTVEDNCFIGCNTNLVSPVTVKKNSYTAAGSTVIEDVPENSLAIARERQINKEDWVIKRGKLRREKP